MHCFKVFLELIELRAELLALRLDACKLPLGVSKCVDRELALDLLELRPLCSTESCQVLSCES